MLKVRKSVDRGHADHGWLNSHHTFSFADYYDPDHMGFRALRVINDDRVAPGQGFGSHSHRDMEIISYVLEGVLAHRDSMGTDGVLRRGDVQRMSAGTGVTHSEFNGSGTDPVHFLQIWLMPGVKGVAPSYGQMTLSDGDKRGRLRLVTSPDGANGSLAIHTDARMYAGIFGAGQRAVLALGSGRHAWVQVASGNVRINGEALAVGDGVAITDEPNLTIEGMDDGEIVLFDLA